MTAVLEPVAGSVLDTGCDSCSRGQSATNSALSTHKCRCAPCKVWHRDQVRVYRAEAKDRKARGVTHVERAPKLPPVRNRLKIEQAIARLGSAHAAADALGIEYVDAAR